MSDVQLLLLYIPVITIASSVAYNSIMFSKESRYLKATYKRKERDRILVLWDLEMKCDCEEAMQHLRERIKGENE